METLPELDSIQREIETNFTLASNWLAENAFVVGNLAQVFLIGFAFLIAKLIVPYLDKWLKGDSPIASIERHFKAVSRVVLPLTLPVTWLILQWLTVMVGKRLGLDSQLVESVVSLLTAWIIIRLMTTVVVNPSLSRFIAVSAWTIAALNILGLLDPTTEFLDSLAIDLGEVHISVLGVVKAAIVISLFMWVASFLSTLFERRMEAMPTVTPSMRVLFGKLFRIFVFTLAIIFGLDAVGIDLTAFAVFSGAVGLGVGLGLQKVVSNLISGIILLADRSVKPGDVISIGETYGSINALGARYVSVVTRNGVEHLIPNEELISQPVENWSYSNKLVRLKIPVGIDYSSDVKKAIAVSLEAAKSVPRILSNPAPTCLLKGFGDNSVDIELRLWISDPEKGVSNVKSEVLLKLWEAYGEQGVDFPFPQRDLHIKSSVPLSVNVLHPEEDAKN